MPVTIKTPDEIDKMRVAGRLAAEVLEMIGEHVKPGISTDELDRICHAYIVEVQQAVPAPLNYRGFPKSICTSVNHQVCHGIPGNKILKNGDIVNIDVTVLKDGFHGDTSKMFYVGEPSIKAKRICEVAYQSMVTGIEMVKPGVTLGEIYAQADGLKGPEKGFIALQAEVPKGGQHLFRNIFITELGNQGAMMAWHRTGEEVADGDDEPSWRYTGYTLAAGETMIINGDETLSYAERTDDGWRTEEIPVEANGTIGIVSAAEESNLLFFQFEGFLRPDTLFASQEAGMNARAVDSLPEFFNADGMTVQQHFATSTDGTRVPYFLVLPRGFEANGATPTLIYGYGGFQVSRTPGYSATVGHAWLARGGAYVVANIRGGGEYGPAWHQAALKENRQRAYDDFIAVAEDLVERGVTSPEHLGIRGGSNGGLLTGVMLTQRPDLWNAVVVQVPLLDMKRYHELLAGASWMAEYGDPDTSDWEFIREYSPYHNLDPDADYPKAFFTTSTRDDRVHPAHARKMVARMNEMGHDLLYFENTVGGHAGASDNTQAARNEALIYSYLWDQLTE